MASDELLLRTPTIVRDFGFRGSLTATVGALISSTFLENLRFCMLRYLEGCSGRSPLAGIEPRVPWLSSSRGPSFLGARFPQAGDGVGRGVALVVTCARVACALSRGALISA